MDNGVFLADRAHRDHPVTVVGGESSQAIGAGQLAAVVVLVIDRQSLVLSRIIRASDLARSRSGRLASAGGGRAVGVRSGGRGEQLRLTVHDLIRLRDGAGRDPSVTIVRRKSAVSGSPGQLTERVVAVGHREGLILSGTVFVLGERGRRGGGQFRLTVHDLIGLGDGSRRDVAVAVV